ncbi:sphingomyelin synthase [Podila verticillata]|nr:sphingomyelin synthase [Podila verticillata]
MTSHDIEPLEDPFDTSFSYDYTGNIAPMSPSYAHQIDLSSSSRERLNRLSSSSTLVSHSRNASSSYTPSFPHPPLSSYSQDSESTSFSSNPSSPSSSPSPRFSSNHSGNNNSNSNNISKNTNAWYRFTHSEAGRLVCAFFYFCFVCIGMAFCNQLSDHRWVETGYTKVLLRDRGFDVIPARVDIGPANFFVMTSVVFTVIGMGLISPTWTARAIVLRRILWVIGTLSVYRSLTLSVTTLPTPKEECVPSLKTGFWDMLIVALQMIPGTVEACTDDIFSGHTVFMVTCAIQWRLYCKNKWITLLSYIYISIGLYFVVATRLHYTVDVVLAVFITYAVWSVYIAMIDVVMEKEYFGIHSHHEKYSVFDTECEDDLTYYGPEYASSARAQLHHAMNHLRGPRIGYSRGEYDRVVFIPMQFNVWLTGLVRWCDGLDLRMRKTVPDTEESNKAKSSRWEEWVIKYRAGQYRIRNARSPLKSEEAYRDGESMEYHREMIESHNHNHSQSMRLDSVRIVSHPDGSVSYGQSRYERGYDRRQDTLFSFRPSSPLSLISKFKTEKFDKIDKKSKIHALKIALIVLVNVILLVKAVQHYQGRSSEPPKEWPEEMVAYPGGKITIDDMEEIQVHEPNHNRDAEASGFVKRGEGENDTWSNLSRRAVPLSKAGMGSAIDYNDVDSVAPVS